MPDTDIQIVSNEAGEPTGVIVPISGFWLRQNAATACHSTPSSKSLDGWRSASEEAIILGVAADPEPEELVVAPVPDHAVSKRDSG